jgi:hypothetical protein
MKISETRTPAPSRLKRRSIGAACLAALAAGAIGCGGGFKIPGVDGLYAGIAGDYLVVSFSTNTFNTDVGLTVPIPGLAHSEFSLSPTLKGRGTLIQFNVHLEDIVTQSTVSTSAIERAGLPDGRRLPDPDIKDGQLPRLDLKLGGVPLNFYFSESHFGFFMPVRITLPKGFFTPFQIVIVIKDRKGKRLGRLYVVPPSSSGGGSGLFISMPVKATQSALIKGANNAQ